MDGQAFQVHIDAPESVFQLFQRCPVLNELAGLHGHKHGFFIVRAQGIAYGLRIAQSGQRLDGLIVDIGIGIGILAQGKVQHGFACAFGANGFETGQCRFLNIFVVVVQGAQKIDIEIGFVLIGQQ